MSKPTTSKVGTSPSATSSSTKSSTNNKLTIIIVAVVCGLLIIIVLVLIIVRFARRRALRRKNKQVEGSSSSDVTSTTVNSRSREVHNRTLSVDASVPLLEPDSSTTGPEYSRFGTLGTLTTQPDSTYPQSGTTPPTPSTTISLNSPHLFAPTFSSFSARPPLPDDLETGPPPPRSRFTRSAPQQPLRHTRTRVARVPMDTLPEDLTMDTSRLRRPSRVTSNAVPPAPAPAAVPSAPSPPPLSHVSSRASTSASISTSSSSPAVSIVPASSPSPPPSSPSPSSWLHIPKGGGIPLISAFRQSISSVASRGSSLPTMQHYPSFSQSQNAYTGSGGSTRSSQTFYSVVSAGNSNGAPSSPTPPPVPPLPSEYGELARPIPPRLKSGGTGERVPQVHLNIPDGHHAASRQASMEYAQNPAVPGSLRPGGKSRPVSNTTGSGSSVSMYADARSQIGGVGEDGRWNGSANGSVGGSSARGRQRS